MSHLIDRRALFALVVLLLLPLILLAQELRDADYPHGEFEDDCTLCHNADAWRPAHISSAFNHAERGFALEGSHKTANCRGCHTTLDFKAVDEQCASCHLDPHQGELGLDCERCHTPRSFIDRSTMIRAHLSTRLPLDGTHRVIDCEDCHRPVSSGNLQFVNLPDACDACHLQEFLGTGDPDHQASGFSQQCDACHSTRAWEPASFNHNQFAAGAVCVDCHLQDYLATTDPDHQGSGFQQQCDDCHSTTAWHPAAFDHDQIPPGTECVSCHLDDYVATTDPAHQTSGIPQTCDDCHSTTAWFPASFDHNQIPPGTECVSCHLDDFLATSDPSHQGSGIPQTCDDCHSTMAWQPATFDHDSFFPIYSGKHNGKWNSCSDCHMNPSNYSQFSCIDCHAHDNPSQLADDHSAVSGYTYDSVACFTCHPTGNS